MRTPFHIRWAPENAPKEGSPPPEEQARFQDLLRELFQFDCVDLDFGIYRIMNHKREVIDRYIDRELPGAIEEAVSQGALETETKRADTFEETRQQLVEFFGEDAIAPNGELLQYQETPLGQKYMLWRERARHSESVGDVRRDIYNHLYAFFSRYYQDGDFVPKRRYSWEHPYVVPYNGEEVHFHWANREQYYVKSAEHFKDYKYRTPSGVSVRFFLRSAHVEQDDVKGKKRFFFPRLDAAVWNGDRRLLDLPFDYRPPTSTEAKDFGRTGQQEAILDRAETSVSEALGTRPEAALALLDKTPAGEDNGGPTMFEHHAQRFARKVTSDYFIHRDLQAFLGRELDYYLKSEVVRLDPLQAGGETRADAWLDKMRIIRDVGGNIIDFLAQIEGFQRMLWEKRKFVVDVHYCVVMRLLPEALKSCVLECDAQWDEWRALGCIGEEDSLFAEGEDSIDRGDFLERNPGILLDTRHFDSAFVDDLLAALDDVDGKTDGVVIKSENWQALNLLEERYRGQVDCIYIDPPYNTGSDGFIYKDQYQHSSWASMVSQAVNRSVAYGSNRSAIFASIDEGEHPIFRFLLDGGWGAHNYVADMVWASGRKNDSRLISVSHEYILVYARDRESLRTHGIRWWQRKPGLDDIYACHKRLKRRHGDDYGAIERDLKEWFRGLPGSHPARRQKHYNRVDARGVYFPDNISWPGTGGPRYDVIHPVTKEPTRVPAAGWRLKEETMKRWLAEDRIHFGEDEHSVPKRKSYLHEHEHEVPYSVFYQDGRAATKRLRDVLGTNDVSYPKDETVIAECIEMTAGDGGTILDYFAGSGTTGHAALNLNRNDGGRRKFILVEMGHRFDTEIMPRLKKVAFSPEWKDGVAKREATAEESERGPRVIKYFRLESYEDALNNIEFEEAEESLFELEDYLLRYMLRWETKGSATLLNVAALERPFDYKLRLDGTGEGVNETVDLAETFNYLLGLAVRTRRTYEDDGRRYLVYAGDTRDKRSAVVIWRDTEGWTAEDRERDRDFVAEHDMTAGADEIWMNGDSMVKDARPLDTLFKQRMFASASDR